MAPGREDVHDIALAALAEANPAAAAALDAAGPNAAGHSCIGYLGWLPETDLSAAAKAVMLGHERAGYPSFGFDGLASMVAGLREAIWRHPRNEREREHIAATVTAWGRARGLHQEAIEAARLSVAAGKWLD